MLLLSSQSFPRYGLERFFDFAKKAGYEGVEISVNANYDTQSIEYLKKLEKRYKIPIKAFSLGKNAEKLIIPFQNLVKEFGGTTVNLCSPEVFSFKYKDWITNIMPKLARKYKLQFCRTNTPFKLFLGFLPSRTENSMYSLREAGNVSLDLSALWDSQEDAMKMISFLGKKLKHVYISNVYKNIKYYLPQKGILPLESFLTRLAQSDFDGNFTLKVAAKNLPTGDNEEKMIDALIEAREFFEKYFK